jgi:F-type H+-transporting ATPase subunit b
MSFLPNLQGFASSSGGASHLFAAGPVTIDIDLSFVVQIVLFAFFIVVMKPILFEPLMKVFEEREKRTGGARVEARAMDEQAATLLKKFDEEHEKVRQAANKVRDALRADTLAREAEILTSAKQESAAIIDAGRAKIRDDIGKLRTDLEAARPALAEQIASTILGREVKS